MQKLVYLYQENNIGLLKEKTTLTQKADIISYKRSFIKILSDLLTDIRKIFGKI
jgi:hypothetical protein